MTSTQNQLLNTMLQRIFDAHAKNKLEELLKAAKKKADAKRDAYKTTGTTDELLSAVTAAIIEKHLTEADIARLVDSVEENGGQHIFLFNLSAKGKKSLTPAAFEKKFSGMPKKPNEEFYAKYPNAKKTYYESRGNLIIVKQVYTTWYWQKNEERSRQTETRRLDYYDRVRRRAINLLRIDTESGEVEIRIDKVHGENESLALKMFGEFTKDLAGVLNLSEHLVDVPVAHGFEGIIKARDETFMSVDAAYDGTGAMSFKKRREATKGMDIRDYPPHARAMKQHVCARESLRVFWLKDKQRFHSIISVVRLDDGEQDASDDNASNEQGVEEAREYAKVFIPAKLEPEELDHVIGRIRFFASA